MSTLFSKFSSPTLKAFNARFRDRSESAFFKKAASSWSSASASGRIDQGVCYAVLYAAYLCGFCRINHIFLSPGVAEFCESAVAELSDEYVKALPECQDVDVTGKDFSPWVVCPSARGGRYITGGIAIHFPAASMRKSILVMPEIAIPNVKNPNSNGLSVRYWFGLDDGDGVVLWTKSVPISETPPHFERSLRLVYGLSLYMDAFPDVVTPSTCDEIKERNHYSGDASTVGVCGMAREDNERSTSPHWRRGHFRMLTSEVFKRKRGQVVFVRGSFVRGRAIDVGPELT